MIAEIKLRRIATWAAGLTAMVGLIALTGWWLNIDGLRRLFPGWALMNQNTALSFLLSGVALLLMQREGHFPAQLTARIITALVGLRAASKLISEILGREMSSPILDLPGAGILSPPGVQIPIGTTLPFVIAALGIFLVGQKKQKRFSLSNWLGLVVICYALIVISGHLLTTQHQPFALAASSVPGFIFLGTALLCSRFDSTLFRVLSPNHPLGFIALRLMLFGLFIPLLIYCLLVWLILPLIPDHHDLLILVVLISTVFLLAGFVSSLQRMESLNDKRYEAEGIRDSLLARLQHQTANLEMQVALRTRRQQETTERLQLALQASDYGVWDQDIPSGRLVWDQRQCELFGIAPETFDERHETFLELIHPEDRERVRLFKLRHNGVSGNFDDEFRIVRPNGEIRHLLTRGKVYCDTDGQPVRIVGLNRDITAERQRDQTVSTLNQRLLFILNASGYGVWEYIFATNKLDWDDHLLEIYGLPRHSLAGNIEEWEARVHPEDLPLVRTETELALKGRASQQQHQFRIVRPDGAERHISSHRYLLRGADGALLSMVGFDSDITGEHELREELRIAEERWQLALAGNNDGVWDWNIAAGEVYRNARNTEIVGYLPSELAPDRHIWQSLGHPEDIPATNAAMADHLEGRKPVYQCEYRLRHKAGYWVWVLDRGKVVARDPKGQPLRVVGTQTDITSRKQLEERLRHGEEMSLQLGRLAQIGAWEWDLSTTQLTWSPEMYRIHEVELGYEPSLAKSLEFYPTPAKNTFSEALQHAVRSGTSFDLELPFVTARNHKLWVRVLGRAEVKDGLAISVYGAFQDITARREAEDMRRQFEGQLFQAQKMETLGTLAGGIAHDFNNLLTGILGYQDLALDSLPEGDSARNYLTASRDASLRARELVDQILTFSRQASSEKVSVNLAQLIDDARRFLRATVPATIRMEVEIAPECRRVLADATQLHQVLLNLGSNAAHAMRATGGAMKIALEPALLNEAEAAAITHIQAGKYLKLTFSDTGHGMDEETRKRIFDPFFTTKEVGQGTGLGLSVVHGIIQAHRGNIIVESTPGQGATFILYLPEAEEGDAEAAAPDTSMPRGNGELIAVVDDEDVVRSFAQMALEKLGYRVAAFDSPHQCLEVLRRQSADFAMLLTDQTMPVMKGIELATEVRHVTTKLPIVIMSGYFTSVAPDKLAQIGKVSLLSKPFTNEELSRTVNRSIYPKTSNTPFPGNTPTGKSTPPFATS
jgi:PAS domain S-box-containing protein